MFFILGVISLAAQKGAFSQKEILLILLSNLLQKLIMALKRLVRTDINKILSFLVSGVFWGFLLCSEGVSMKLACISTRNAVRFGKGKRAGELSSRALLELINYLLDSFLEALNCGSLKQFYSNLFLANFLAGRADLQVEDFQNLFNLAILKGAHYIIVILENIPEAFLDDFPLFF